MRKRERLRKDKKIEQAGLIISQGEQAGQRLLATEDCSAWTDQKLREQRPDVAEAIIALYLQGVGYRALAQSFRLSNDTIRSVLTHSKIVTDCARMALSTDMRHTSRRLLERVHEVLDDDKARQKLSAKDAAFAADTLAGRAESMEGRAAIQLDVTISDPGRDEFLRLAIGSGRPTPQTLLEAAGTGLDSGAAREVIDVAFSPGEPPGEPGEPVLKNAETLSKNEEKI